MKKTQGQVALETLVVIIAWLLAVFLFLNLLFVLNTAMLAQASLNRVAVQTSALGCKPPNIVADDLRDNFRGFFVGGGIDSVEYKVVDANNAVSAEVPECVSPTSGDINPKVPYGRYIRVTLKYRQRLLFLAPGEETITRSAFVVSGRLEDG